jgi:hypothetical protein
VGEKSAKLRTLSEQRRVLDLGDQDDGQDDEIRGSSDSETDGDGAGNGGRYETVANREKRKRLEGLAKLKARRSGETSTGSNNRPSPFRPVTNTESNGKRSTSTVSCPVCAESVSFASVRPA